MRCNDAMVKETALVLLKRFIETGVKPQTKPGGCVDPAVTVQLHDNTF